MATYCFRCRGCGESWEDSVVGPHYCPFPDVIRDYRAESVGMAVVSLARERERGGPSAVRDLFLPTAKDLAGPHDPDGSKGIAEWNDTHDPKPGNKMPMRPERPTGSRKVF